jgi:mRNA-degrading endonuclease RelE of RelBE toxin-antitoxin system
MCAEYRDLYTPTFRDCLSRHKDKRTRVEDVVNRILEDPFHQSHLLGKKRGIDLRGKRARHFQNTKFVIIFVVCDECIKAGFRASGYNACPSCTGNPDKAVIFLAVSSHADIYTRQWDVK